MYADMLWLERWMDGSFNRWMVDYLNGWMDGSNSLNDML